MVVVVVGVEGREVRGRLVIESSLSGRVGSDNEENEGRKSRRKECGR